MGEEALFEVEPHALDRVQLGRIGWQRQQRAREAGGVNTTYSII